MSAHSQNARTAKETITQEMAEMNKQSNYKGSKMRPPSGKDVSWGA